MLVCEPLLREHSCKYLHISVLQAFLLFTPTMLGYKEMDKKAKENIDNSHAFPRFPKRLEDSISHKASECLAAKYTHHQANEGHRWCRLLIICLRHQQNEETDL